MKRNRGKRLFGRGVLIAGLLSFSIRDAVAEKSGGIRPTSNPHRVDLGIVALGSETTQTAKGPMQIVGRIVDTVRSDSTEGCRLALAMTISPHSPKLRVVVDGVVPPTHYGIASGKG